MDVETGPETNIFRVSKFEESNDYFKYFLGTKLDHYLFKKEKKRERKRKRTEFKF